MKLFISILIIISTFSLSIGFADVTTRNGSNDQSQALIQQLGVERTRLIAENSKLKKQLKEAESKLEDIENENAKTNKKLNSVQGQLNSKSDLSDKLTERLSQAKARLEELIVKFRETVTNLRTVETESANRAQQITKFERELNSCAMSNLALSKIGFEVLDNYENKGFWDRAGQKEPFTQIKRVQIENLVDEYTYLIQDQEYALPNSQ